MTRTSIEFLEVLRDNPAFTNNEKAALSDFLESVDLLKYARLSAAANDIRRCLKSRSVWFAENRPRHPL